MIYSKAYQIARIERLAFAKNSCEFCRHDGENYRLECHHKDSKAYQRDKAGTITINDVVIVCVRCHDCITDKDRRERYSKKQLRTAVTERPQKIAIDFRRVNEVPTVKDIEV